MSETTQDTIAMFNRPSWRQRCRWALGFRYHLGDEPNGADKLAGWMQTPIRFRFSWRDRFRLLTTGRLTIVLTQHMSASVDHAVNRVDWQIHAPWESHV